jgi:hypothetical protein
MQATGLEWSSSVQDSAQQLMLEHGEPLKKAAEPPQ